MSRAGRDSGSTAPGRLPASLTAAFEYRVARKPRALALKGDGVALSYAALNAQADALAITLVERCGPSNIPVPLLCRHGAAAIVGILAILKAGKCYVPLNPASPVDYLRRLWRHSGASVVLADEAEAAMAGDICGTMEQYVPLSLRGGSGRRAAPSFDNDPEKLAAIVYTSGTTELPKGVMTTHHSILDRVAHQVLAAKLTPADRQASVVFWGYAAAFPDIFGALLSGAILLPYDLGGRGLGPFVDWLNEQAVTLLHLPAAAVNGFLETARHAKLRRVRMIYLSGARLSQAEAEGLWNVFPRADLLHGYGSSEANLISQFVLHPRRLPKGDPLPVGNVVPGKDVQIIDKSGQPVADGILGELTVIGLHLSPGYWADRSATDRVFREEPDGRRRFFTGDLGWFRPDGLLELAGRKDFVAKIRGNRVDLLELEGRLRSLSGITEAAVAVHPRPSGEDRLVAYVVPAPESHVTPKGLREELERALPLFMIPGRLIVMEALPLTPSGKVDRRALPPPQAARSNPHVAFRPPRDEEERRVCEAWAEALEVGEVGMDDDFFDLGGDSLSAVRMLAWVEEILGAKIPAAFFESPTVAGLFAAVRNESGPVSNSSRKEAGASRPEMARARPPRPRSLRSTTDLTLELLRSPEKRVRLGEAPAPLTAMLMPYTIGCRWLAWLSSGRGFVRRFYSRQFELFCRFLNDFQCTVSDPETLFRANLVGNLVRRATFWQLEMMSNSSDTIIEALRISRWPFRRSAARLIEHGDKNLVRSWFPCSGLRYLEEALARGRGVVLLSFHGTGQVLAARAARRFLDGGRSIRFLSRQMSRLRAQGVTLGDWRHVPAAGLEIARDTIAAQRHLEGGGLVQIVADGTPQRDGIPCPIGGRLYSLNAGFAELALVTGATIIPWSAFYDEDGRVRAEFFPPLTTEVAADREAQITDLVKRHAGIMERIWRENPASLNWPLIEVHESLPRSQ